MEKNRRKVIRAGISQAANNSEFPAWGISPPEAGAPPCSISPLADNSLSAFAQSEAGGIESPGAAVRLSEFMGKKNRNRRRRQKPAASRRREIIKPVALTGEIGNEDLVSGVESLSVLDSENSSSLKSSDPSENQIGEKYQEEPDSEEQQSPKHQGDGGASNSFVAKLLRQLDELHEPASVPDDEISRNKQEQDDEIVALEAIYEGAFRAINDTCFMIEVPMELAGDTIEVVLEQASRLSSSPSSSSSSSSSRYTFTLEFLPPIRFCFSFPRSYPSRSPPVFVLESEWIPAEKLILLSEKLSRIWEEQSGEVVVYPWNEFLHSQALRFLWASEQLVLELSACSYQVDHPRIISRSSSQQTTAAYLLAHNEEMRETTFLASLHECNICFTEFSGKEFIRLSCEHLFCESCMSQHSSMHVAEGTLSRLVCPSCPAAIPPFVLKRLLSGEEFERWENLLLQKTLDSMSDVVYCPRCETPCIEDSSDNHAQCEKCFFSFCGLCLQNWHAGRRCLTPDQRILLLEERAKGFRTEEQRQREQNMINELRNIEAVQREAKLCPTCNMAIVKTEGCNKMTCSNCGKYFCFVCGKSIDGYTHFTSGECQLVDVEQMPEDHAIWQIIQRNEQRIRAERAAALNPERLRACPACGKKNPKIKNNNHIFCNSCQRHYCGLCLKSVRRAPEHFGPGKCKQHSA